tara:strand:- start:154 stop:279 length:126 start_codon:yes stop_codon:yes gene_type:complete
MGLKRVTYVNLFAANLVPHKVSFFLLLNNGKDTTGVVWNIV